MGVTVRVPPSSRGRDTQTPSRDGAGKVVSDRLRTLPLGQPHCALRRVSAVSTRPVGAGSLPAGPEVRWSQGEVAPADPALPPGLVGGAPFATTGAVLELICEWPWGLQAEPVAVPLLPREPLGASLDGGLNAPAPAGFSGNNEGAVASGPFSRCPCSQPFNLVHPFHRM